MIPNISLLTGNLQPKGHPFFVDKKTVDGAAALLADKPLAAHLSHEGSERDRLGSSIGFFRGIYADGLSLRAKTFEFLDSFKANFKAQYDNLSELAQKFPEQFGVSLHLRYTPVWVMRDGSEVPAKIVDGRLAESAPADAVRPLPSARVTAIPAGDFVTSPAANLHGLLSGLLAEIDTTPNNMSDQTPATFDQAALDAKLAEQKQAITAELSAQLETAEKARAELDAKLADAVKASAELTAKLATAEAALTARDAELIATLAAVGIKMDKFEAPALQAALDARISDKAQSFLAERGLKPLPEKLNNETVIDANLSDQAIYDKYAAMKVGPERVAFLSANSDAIWRANGAK